MQEPETTPKPERVSTFAKTSDATEERRQHTALGNSVDSMESDYHKFKQSRK